MEERLKILISELGLRAKQNVNLKDYLEIKNDSQARLLYIAVNAQELVQTVRLVRDLDIPFLVVGSGSKLTLDNTNFEGLVIKNQTNQIKMSGIKGKFKAGIGLGVEEVMLEVGSGILLSDLADYLKGQNLHGAETVTDLTGTIGGNFMTSLKLQQLVTGVKLVSDSHQPILVDSNAVTSQDVIVSVMIKGVQ